MNLFDPKDYQSITIHVKVKNLTSGIDVVVPPVGKDSRPEDNAIQLIEFRDKGGAVFIFPKNSCAVGHNLEMVLNIKDYTQSHTMSVTGKVLSVENDQSQFSNVVVQFVQFIQDDWEKFLEIYSARQQEILVFFEAVKGES